jgi:hypothetical protein
MFRMNFGAKFVFKLLSKYAFKNNLENGQKSFVISFISLSQNLFGIRLCTF